MVANPYNKNTPNAFAPELNSTPKVIQKNQVRCLMPIILALRRLGQEDEAV